MYLITFYFTCIVIAVLIIFLIYYCIKFNSKFHITNKFVLTFIYAVLKAVNTFLYMPILYLLCSVFACVKEHELFCYDGHRYYDYSGNNSVSSGNSNSSYTNSNITSNVSDIKVNHLVKSISCFHGIYYLHFSFGIAFALVFIVLNVFLKHTFYSIKFSTSYPLSKISNELEKINIYFKSLLCVLFCIFSSETNNWILILVLIICGNSLLYVSFIKHPDNNEVIQKAKLFSYAIFAWSTFVLFIGQILITTVFDGCIGLFFIGMPIVLSIVLTSQINSTHIIIDFNDTQNVSTLINNLRCLIKLIRKKDKTRKANIILKGYIFDFELSCPIKMCPLKQYLQCKRKNEDNSAFLLQHVDWLFTRAKAKFRNNIQIKLIYAVFLSDCLNKKQQAIIEIDECELNHMTFDEEFQCYRLRKQIEEQTMDTSEQNYNNQTNNNNVQTNNDNNNNTNTNYSSLDVASNLAYKKYFHTFKTLINKASVLYIDFWSMLLNPTQDSKQLSKLNKCGTKINESVEEIKDIFNKIQKVKYNDKQTITLYSDFLSNILNDKEHAFQLKQLIKNNELKQSYDEKNYFNLDLAALASSDEYQYIVVSGKPDNLGVVIHISLGVCLLLGYNRNELIGKSYEIFMPQMFHKEHRQILIDKVSEFKQKLINYNTNNNENNNYREIFKDVLSLAKTRARYLIPLLLKTILINTENIGPTFISKVYKESILNINNIDKKSKKHFNKTITQGMRLITSNMNKHSISINQICVILTNNNFIIQNFTANAIGLLGINSNYMNNSTDICSYIKQFHEEFLKYSTDNDKSLTSEEKNSLKRQIALSRFKMPTIIEWKMNDSELIKFKETKLEGCYVRDSNSQNYNEDDFKMPSSMKKSPKSNLNVVNCIYQYFYLTIHEVTMGSKQEGYIFKFELALIDNCDSKFSSKDLSSRKINPPGEQSSFLLGGSSKFQTAKLIPSVKSKKKMNHNVETCSSNNNIQSFYDDNSIIHINNNNNNNTNNSSKKLPHKEQDETPMNDKLTRSEQSKNIKKHLFLIACNKYSPTSYVNYDGTEINKNYIPLDNTSFLFDANKISYLLNPKNSEDIKESIKQKAFDKIKEEVGFDKLIDNNNNEEEEDENEEYEEGEGEEEESDEKDSSIGHSSNVHNSTVSSKLQCKNISQGLRSSIGLGMLRGTNSFNSVKNQQESFISNDVYYKVNFDKIKFSIYDFQRRVIVEKPYEKISQVDFKKREVYHQKKESNIFDDPLGMNEFSAKNEYNETNNSFSSSYLPDNNLHMNQDSMLLSPKDRKIILMKQIEYSLSNQDAHNELTHFQVFGFILFVIIMGFVLGLTFRFTTTKNLLDENFNMIISNYNIISKALNSLAYLRELILLSNDKYDAFLINKENDTQRILDELDSFYIQMHSDITKIIITSLPLDQSERDALFVNLINVSVLQDDHTLNIIKMPVTSAFLEINTALFHLIKNNKNNTYYPLESYMFFIIDNLNNDLFIELQKAINIFSREITHNHNNMFNTIIYIESAFCIILISSLFIANWLFNKILHLKASYLEVFLEIGKNVIRSSLEKCENFSRKIQSDTLSELTSNSEDDNLITNDLSLVQGNTNANAKLISDNIHNNTNSGIHFHKKKHKKRKTQNFLLKVSFFIFICLILIISFLLVLFFGIALNHVENNIYCFSRNKDMEILYLKLYNYVRDYMFDSNFHVEGRHIQDTINSFLKYFYKNISKDKEEIRKYLDETPIDFQQQYFKFFHSDLCVLLNQTNDIECLKMASNSTLFGLNIMLTNFFEEMLVLKSKKKHHVVTNNNRFKYNLTLTNTIYEKEYLDTLTPEDVKDYFKGHCFYLYNTIEHKSIKKMYMNYVVGAFEHLNNMMIKSIENYGIKQNLLFLVLWIIFGSVIIISYFSVWLPIQLSLNHVIFKTKNMLRIIPKEVLVNVPTIPFLLGIQRKIHQRENGFQKKR